VLPFNKGCTPHDGGEQGIDRQIFNRKSISHKIMDASSVLIQMK